MGTPSRNSRPAREAAGPLHLAAALRLAGIDHNSRDADLRTYRMLSRAALARAVW